MDGTTESVGTESEGTCQCCGRLTFEGIGVLSTDGIDVARYWYRWSEGHEGRFALAIATDDPAVPAGVGVVRAQIRDGSLIYTVLDPDDSPWVSFGEFDPHLTRKDVLTPDCQRIFFELVDLIVAREPRLASRILALGELH
jgi:hypothetical protein